MSTSTDNPGSKRVRWRVITVGGQVFKFEGGPRFVVGDVLPDGAEIDSIEFEMDLDSSWRLTAVLRIGEGGAEPVELRFSEMDGAPGGSRWELFNQHGELVLEMSGWGMFGRRTAAPPSGGAAAA